MHVGYPHFCHLCEDNECVCDCPACEGLINHGSGSLDTLASDNEWNEIKITVDSGACDHVINPSCVDTSQVSVTDSVRNGVTYRTASGHVLPNLGETVVSGVTGSGHPLSLTMQVAGVNKPLASVRKMCLAGNRVVFEDQGDTALGGYVQNIDSGVKVPITKEGGTYQVSLWTPQAPPARNSSYFAPLAGVDEGDDEEPSHSATASSSFQRPA